jgi:hypothetical protein
MSDLAFAVQVFLERHFAPVLILCRRLIVGYPYRRIPLTQGKFACVDPQDYPALARYKWCAANQGNSWYAVRTDGKCQVRMHRVIMDAPPGLVVDHIDHDGLNNVRRKLRLCTPQQNARNQRPQQGGSSEFIGVCWLKNEKKWWARLQNNGHQRSLGLFTNEREAARTRDAAALAQHGEFASLNFPKRPFSRLRRIVSRIACPLRRRRRQRAKCKFEAQNPKSETNPNAQTGRT